MHHTPGPWAIVDRVVRSRDGSNVSGLVPSRMTEADMALIVAAPKLLEACKLALERLKPEKNIKKNYSEWVAYAALGQAVYEAEGRST